MFEAIGDWVVNGNRNATFKCDQEGVQRSMNSSRGAMQSEFVVVAADEKARLHCAKINLEPGAGRGDRAKPDPTIRCRPGIFGMASGGCSGGYAFVFVGAPAGGIAGSRSPKTRQAHGTCVDGADGTVTPLARSSTAARDVTASAHGGVGGGSEFNGI